MQSSAPTNDPYIIYRLMSSQDYSHNEDEPHEEEPDEIGF